MSDLPAGLHLEHTYADALPELTLAWRAAPVEHAELLVLDEALADELGLDAAALRTPQGVAALVGDLPQEVPTGAQAYAGHQFGGWSPLLGDGRALLLGEQVTPAGERRDLHLKGSGRTPFSRGGDGLAAVGPMLREHLMGVAMHALGVPTTRSLAVLATGGTVRRERLLPGAVLVRSAASHLRVGTFQLAATQGSRELLERLASYAIGRHHPQAAHAERPALALLEAVAQAQAELVAAWMALGFVHGVMNTDNVTISGETIDYGPCAFMEGYDPATVYSSIDTTGRYAYGNQPAMAQWALARLAEALLPVIDDDPAVAVDLATDVVVGFAQRYEEAFVARVSTKIGLARPDRVMVDEVLGLLAAEGVDWTGFWWRLGRGDARELFADPAAFDDWAARRSSALGDGAETVARRMHRANPLYVPRNKPVEAALEAATGGDLGPFQRLLEAVAAPYDERPGLDDLTRPAPPEAPAHVTYCGT